VQLNDLMTQRCNALASALDERKEEVANLDHQITLCQQRIQSLDAEILRLQKIIEKEKRRKIFWKTVAGVEAVVVVVVTTVTLIK
jgi:septal ring factor EnvC (AmiA/AmiB activator)